MDAATGAEKWSFDAVGSATFTGASWLTRAGSTLFALAENDVYALDAATGALKWQFNLPRYPAKACLVEFLTGPAVLDSVVFVDARGDTLSNLCFMNEFTAQIRLDAATGTQRGETKIEKALFVHPETLFGVKAIKGRLYQNTSGKVYTMGAK